MKRAKAEAKQIIERADYLRSLLNEFGARLHSFDPGVAAMLPDTQLMSFGQAEWEWLEPLLIELRDRRMTETKL